MSSQQLSEIIAQDSDSVDKKNKPVDEKEKPPNKEDEEEEPEIDLGLPDDRAFVHKIQEWNLEDRKTSDPDLTPWTATNETKKSTKSKKKKKRTFLDDGGPPEADPNFRPEDELAPPSVFSQAHNFSRNIGKTNEEQTDQNNNGQNQVNLNGWQNGFQNSGNGEDNWNNRGYEKRNGYRNQQRRNDSQRPGNQYNNRDKQQRHKQSPNLDQGYFGPRNVQYDRNNRETDDVRFSYDGRLQNNYNYENENNDGFSNYRVSNYEDRSQDYQRASMNMGWNDPGRSQNSGFDRNTNQNNENYQQNSFEQNSFNITQNSGYYYDDVRDSQDYPEMSGQNEWQGRGYNGGPMNVSQRSDNYQQGNEDNYPMHTRSRQQENDNFHDERHPNRRQNYRDEEHHQNNRRIYKNSKYEIRESDNNGRGWRPEDYFMRNEKNQQDGKWERDLHQDHENGREQAHGSQRNWQQLNNQPFGNKGALFRGVGPDGEVLNSRDDYNEHRWENQNEFGEDQAQQRNFDSVPDNNFYGNQPNNHRNGPKNFKRNNYRKKKFGKHDDKTELTYNERQVNRNRNQRDRFRGNENNDSQNNTRNNGSNDWSDRDNGHRQGYDQDQQESSNEGQHGYHHLQGGNYNKNTRNEYRNYHQYENGTHGKNGHNRNQRNGIRQNWDQERDNFREERNQQFDIPDDPSQLVNKLTTSTAPSNHSSLSNFQSAPTHHVDQIVVVVDCDSKLVDDAVSVLTSRASSIGLTVNEWIPVPTDSHFDSLDVKIHKMMIKLDSLRSSGEMSNNHLILWVDSAQNSTEPILKFAESKYHIKSTRVTSACMKNLLTNSKAVQETLRTIMKKLNENTAQM